MRKLILSVFLIVLSLTVNAQVVSKNALGLRFGGDNTGYEFSYQRGLSDTNRFEADLGMASNNHYSAFKLTGLYQWVWNIDGGFNWYAGVGGGLGSYSNKDGYYHDSNGSFGTLNGDLGIEYDFDIPLQISLDWRPGIYFGNYYNEGYNSNLALGLRYRFD